MTVPEFPSGDLLPGIGNDQVLIKKWTVRKDNRAQISVLTSLPPRNWSKHVKVAEENPEQRRKIIEACSPSETDENVIHHEVRIVNGETRLSTNPSSSQKFSRNKQAGGGAYIPATLRIVGPSIHAKLVLERIRKRPFVSAKTKKRCQLKCCNFNLSIKVVYKRT
ncbi:uncharacterized protein LOC114973333 isoform X1 [Acropora millepora]|uniref:uncharacterized protein LOC114973333 isoform X1 n=1 Tax=Acropora millepora TaxID=45264 RepID=UPI001CF58C06|nr:uncharacterized protein LOC114973333 isoform X1 [Acropora millepora]